MDSGLLSLKWNNHSSTFFHVLETIRRKELYSDVTIACDGKFFSVHKLVLSTCSEYFQEMFEKTQCKHPVIVLKDINHKDLESLLNYMYIGEVNVIQTELSSLIKAAECLRVKGLAVPDEPPPSQKKSNKRPNTNDKEDNLSSKRNRRSGSFSQNQLSSSSSKDDRGNANTSSLSSSDLPSHPALGGSKEIDSRLDNQSDHSYKKFEPVLIKMEKEDVNTENYVENDLPAVSKFEYDGDSVENEANVHQRLDDSSESSFSSHQQQQQQQSADDSMGHLMPSTSGFQGESSSWGSEMEGEDKERGEGGSYDPGSSYLVDNSQAKSQVASYSLEGSNTRVISPLSSHSHSSSPKEPPPLLPIVRPQQQQDKQQETLEDSPQKAPPFSPSQLWSAVTQRFMEKDGPVWKCTYPFCFYNSHSRVNLLNHVRKHTGEKPFSCHKCDYRSNQCSNLYTHLKRKHKE